MYLRLYFYRIQCPTSYSIFLFEKYIRFAKRCCFEMHRIRNDVVRDLHSIVFYYLHNGVCTRSTSLVHTKHERRASTYANTHTYSTIKYKMQSPLMHHASTATLSMFSFFLFFNDIYYRFTQHLLLTDNIFCTNQRK